MAGTIVVDRIESDASYASNINVASQITFSNTVNLTVASTFPAGTVGAPSITTAGDTNTGLYFPAADTIAFSEGGAEAMRINSSGNVGIGTSSPVSKLQVVADQASYVNDLAQLTITGTNTNQRLLLGYNTSTDKAFIQATKVGTAYQDLVLQSGGGNVLANTTSNIAAGAKIFAVGSGQGIAVGSGTGATAYRHLYMNSGDGTLYFFNDTNYASLSPAGAWVNASDARLKKNIVDIKYGLADVLRMQPRSYQMNDVAGDFVGFVAQELQTVIPEVVTGDPEKQLGVDYGSLVAVAFKAIQELKALNDTQAATITALTARIVALES